MTLEYPRRYWLQALAIGPFAIGAWLLTRRMFVPRQERACAMRAC